MQFTYPESLHIGISTGTSGTELTVGARTVVINVTTKSQAEYEGREYGKTFTEDFEGEAAPPLVSGAQFDADKELIDGHKAGDKVACPDYKTIINSSLSYSPLQCEITTLDSQPALKRYYYPSPWDHDAAMEYTIYIGDQRVDILSSPRAKDLNDYLQKEQQNTDPDFKLANQIIKTITFPAAKSDSESPK